MKQKVVNRLCSYFFFIILLNCFKSVGPAKIKATIINKVKLIGRVTKVLQSPEDSNRDLLRFDSNIGPKIIPRTIGAIGNLANFKIKPIIPATIKIPISNIELLIAYEPTKQNTKTAGIR